MGEFENRLTILKLAGQIGDNSIELATRVLVALKSEHDISLTEQNGAMLITHIVMANERVISGNVVEPLANIIKEQLNNDPNIARAKLVTNTVVKEFGTDFDEVERDYILMHICNLVGSPNANISN